MALRWRSWFTKAFALRLLRGTVKFGAIVFLAYAWVTWIDPLPAIQAINPQLAWLSDFVLGLIAVGLYVALAIRVPALAGLVAGLLILGGFGSLIAILTGHHDGREFAWATPIMLLLLFGIFQKRLEKWADHLADAAAKPEQPSDAAPPIEP